MDETDIKIKGKWKYLYRAVDKEGSIVDYLLTAKRDKKLQKGSLLNPQNLVGYQPK
jgi:transposase-like protein